MPVITREYDRNENYENTKPKFDKVVFNYISDPVLVLQDGKSYFSSNPINHKK